MAEHVQGDRPLIPISELPRDQRVPFSRSFYRRVRLGTNALVAGVFLSCLVYDWDAYLGTDQHMFRSIRPAVRGALDWVWDVEGASSRTPPPSGSAPAPAPARAGPQQ